MKCIVHVPVAHTFSWQFFNALLLDFKLNSWEVKHYLVSVGLLLNYIIILFYVYVISFKIKYIIML